MSSVLGASREPEIQAGLAEVLLRLGRDREMEFQTGDGPADIYLPARRFVIETKSRGAAHPSAKGPGDRGGGLQRHSSNSVNVTFRRTIGVNRANSH